MIMNLKGQLDKVVKRLVAIIIISLILSGCNTGKDDLKIVTGPEIDILNVIEVGISIDTYGEIVLKGGVSIPTPIHTEILDVNWNVGFEKVLVAASTKTNHLYIVWEDENGKIHSETYDIQKSFNINFAKEDWVRNISNTGEGTIVVAIEKQEFLAESNWQPADKEAWSDIISVRMPSLNEIRDDLISIWDANLLDVKDIPSPGLETYHGTVNPDQEYLWSFYWCAKNKEILTENVQHLAITFSVNGEKIPDDILNYDHYLTKDKKWYCAYWDTIVYDWPRGRKLEMIIEYVIDTQVNDGVKSYPAGTYKHLLNVEVNE